MAKELWIGIEVSRQVRVADGVLTRAGDLAVRGVNLLERQIKLALGLTQPERVCVLAPQPDARVLELVGEHGVHEMPPLDFVAMLAERVKAGEKGSVLLLRQIAPLRDARPLKKALKLLKKHPVIVSASEPPAGHPRRAAPDGGEADLRCLAFEARRMDRFSHQAMGDFSAEEHLLFMDWQDFGELLRPEDEAEVAARLAAWGA
jgi:hypothetical protein